MKRKTIFISLIVAVVGLISYKFLKPASPVEWAEQITDLEISRDAEVLKFHNGSSVIWGGGIICGELSMDGNQSQELINNAIRNGYVYADSLGRERELSLVTQNACFNNTNADIKNHKGYFKITASNAKESQFAAFDLNTNRLHFFKSKASDAFQ